MYRLPGWLNCISVAQRCKRRDGADGTSTEEGGFSDVAASRRSVSRWLTEASSVGMGTPERRFSGIASSRRAVSQWPMGVRSGMGRMA